MIFPDRECRAAHFHAWPSRRGATHLDRWVDFFYRPSDAIVEVAEQPPSIELWQQMVGPFVLDVRFIFDFPVAGGAPAVLNLIRHISRSQFGGGVKRFNRWCAEGIFLTWNLGVHKAWPDVEALREFQFWVSHPELIEGSLLEN